MGARKRARDLDEQRGRGTGGEWEVGGGRQTDRLRGTERGCRERGGGRERDLEREGEKHCEGGERKGARETQREKETRKTTESARD